MMEKQEDGIPKNKISISDATKFNRAITNKPMLQVWPLAYGHDIAATMTAISAAFITYFFRKKLNLRAFARISCYLPIVGVSTMLTDLYQSTVITKDIMKGESCPLCITTKGTFSQLLLGVAYPLLLAPVMTFNLADRLLTYPVPPLSRAPKEVFQLWMKVVQKNRNPIALIIGFHIVGGTFITHQKQVKFDQFMRNELA